MRKLLTAAVVAAFLSGCMTVQEPTETARAVVPSCAEDELIVGAGDFTAGYWDRYQCGHPDSFIDEDAVTREICARPRHWERMRGVTVMPEGCETTR